MHFRSMRDKTEIDKCTHYYSGSQKVTKEQCLGFKIVHVCFAEEGDSVLGVTSSGVLSSEATRRVTGFLAS